MIVQEMNKCQEKDNIIMNIIIEEYKNSGELFNITGDSSDPIYLKDLSDNEISKIYDDLKSNNKLHWKEEWLFIFGDIILKRRINKINKLKTIINGNT